MATATSISAVAPKRQNERPGEVLLQHGLASDALPHLLDSHRQEPKEWRHLLNMAIAYRYLGRWGEAQAALAEAQNLDPKAWPVYHTWANVLEDLGLFDLALKTRWKAWDLCGKNRQEVALGIAVELMRKGEWVKAWPYWELGRFKGGRKPNSIIKPWAGEPLEGKSILVLTEGGYGDVFDFSRWFGRLKKQGAKIKLVVYERQIEIMKMSPDMEGVEFMPMEGQVNIEDYEYMTSLMSIPSILGAMPSDVPPHITFDIAPMKFEKYHLPRIGICWEAEEKVAHRKVRTIPTDKIEKFSMIKAEWYSLVPNQRLPWMNDGPTNWVDTARLMLTLDKVVTVDTAVLHLAGCLGIPTIAMVPVCSEWRWLEKRTDTIWYDKMQLVRGHKPEYWDDVVAEAMRLV